MALVTKERVEKEIENETIVKKLLEAYREAKKTKKKKVPRTLKARFIDVLFSITMASFMWGVRIEKHKYPIYWTGPYFKHHKYTTWLLILAGLLSIKMKYRGRAACVIFDGGRKLSVAQCDLQLNQEMNYLYYQHVCETGAKIYRKLAKEYNQKSFELKEVKNGITHSK